MSWWCHDDHDDDEDVDDVDDVDVDDDVDDVDDDVDDDVALPKDQKGGINISDEAWEELDMEMNGGNVESNDSNVKKTHYRKNDERYFWPVLTYVNKIRWIQCCSPFCLKPSKNNPVDSVK